jgi:uncharacterized protein DUF1569
MKTLADRHDTDEVLARLAHVRADTPRQWGQMSAPQMICHLSDAFRMAGDNPLPDDSTLSQRTLIKWLALYAPMPWPTGTLVTRPEIDQVSGTGCRPGAFDADVARLRGDIETFTSRNRNTRWPAHPFFGAMSSSAWLRWGYLHMDHHLRQFGA